MRRGLSDHRQIRRRHIAHHLRRCAHQHRAIGYLQIRRHKRSGRNDAVPADMRTVEDDGTVADQRFLFDHAAVQQHHMADRPLAPDQRRGARIGMDHAAILHVAAAADFDALIVGAQYTIEPEARAGVQDHRADDLRAWGDVKVLARGLQPPLTETVDACIHAWESIEFTLGRIASMHQAACNVTTAPSKKGAPGPKRWNTGPEMNGAMTRASDVPTW